MLCCAALLEVDDFLTAGSRTPHNTPPERRRENVYELGEVLEALQSVGKKNEACDGQICTVGSLLEPVSPKEYGCGGY